MAQMEETKSANANDVRDQAADFVASCNEIKAQIGRAVVGQEQLVEGVLVALLAGGHVLIEGVPGVGKTLLVRTLAEAIDVKFTRIQFTPDVMPADIQGTAVLVNSSSGGHELQFQEGPLISNLVLADEINRATPKTQSALLEAMQEQQITLGNRTIALGDPYCVLATQNPVEQEGTYALPEAQLDRFLFKLIAGYPLEEDYGPILDRTTGIKSVGITVAARKEEINRMKRLVRAVPVPEHVKTYAIRLTMASQPNGIYSTPLVNEYVALGSSPRGAQGLLLAAKVKALLDGRFAACLDDIRAYALPVLRHRLVLNFHGRAKSITADRIVENVIDLIKEPNSAH